VKDVTTGTTYLTLVVFGTICTFQPWMAVIPASTTTTTIARIELLALLDMTRLDLYCCPPSSKHLDYIGKKVET
jgi:hypothetical protein